MKTLKRILFLVAVASFIAAPVLAILGVYALDIVYICAAFILCVLAVVVLAVVAGSTGSPFDDDTPMWLN